jgi:sugar phosphate isomerase/epimerase
MIGWPVGLSTGCFYETSIFKVLPDIRESGISILEICSYPAHLDYHDHTMLKNASAMLQQLNLKPFSFHAPFDDMIDITSPDREMRKESVSGIMIAVKAASLLKVRYFVIHPGPEMKNPSPNNTHFRRLKSAAESLQQVSAYCREKGMHLILENMLPHLLFGKTADLFWIMEEIDSVDTGICLDTGHAFLAGELFTLINKLSSPLKMIHAADNLGEFDDHLPPGQGKINWEQLLSKLYNHRFNGPFILELSGDREKTVSELLGEASKARNYLNSIMEKIHR